MLARIKICFALGSDAFERDVVSLIHRYAAYVHQLPYTPDAEFSEPGGLLRLGLRTAYFALQGTDAHIFSGRATISQRQLAEPRWRMATFIAGLCGEIYQPLNRLEAINDQGEVWPCCVLPLFEWLKQGSTTRYTLRWRVASHDIRAMSLFVLPHIVPANVMQDLATGHPSIVPHMLASIAGQANRHEHNVVGSLVAHALALVMEGALNARAEQTGRRPPGTHYVRYLLECMRQLAATHGGWTANAEKSRVWHGADGLFLAWPGAAIDIGKQLDTDLLPGIPREPDEVLSTLIDAGIMLAQGQNGPVWSIQPPSAKAPLLAIKLKSASLLFDCDELIPSALETSLAVPLKPSTCSNTDLAPHPIAPAPAPAPQSQPAVTHATSSVAPNPTQIAEPQETVHAVPQSDLFPSSTPSAKDAALRIKAPLRLAQPLRMALQQLASSSSARLLDEGLFLPLSDFAAHRIEPSTALRSLTDTGMLVLGTTSGTATSTWTLPGPEGTEVVGLVIASRFIDTGSTNAAKRSNT